MIFNTYAFALFAACFFPGYWLIRSIGLRSWWLLGGCAVFHGHFAGPAGMLPIAALALITYACALSRLRALCYAAIAACIAALVFYKYTHFVSRELLAILAPDLSARATTLSTSWLPDSPPLALSFFAFEFVHYLVDVAGGSTPIRSPKTFALFAIYFPSLVAGPVKRYQDFTAALPRALAHVELTEVAAGAQRVALGFFKKILLADNLTVALAFYEKDFSNLSAPEAWLFLAALSARILLDFSGYTDIALGLSQMLGLRLPENFNYPYAATGLRDFWSRWHISLSSWIRDYVYIPLGGNRHGPLRRSGNLIIAFALCGLWHGGAWHFVLWGLWHGVGLVLQATYRKALGSLGARLGSILDRFAVLSWLLTLVFVAFGWLLFFYPASQAWSMALKLITFH
jgi:alginate O-acetyltransferase complex protein AlgI